MLSWDQTKPPRLGSPSDVAGIPNGTYPVGSLSIVANDQAVHLVLTVRSSSGSTYSPIRQIGILLAERQEAKHSKEVAEMCQRALEVKFGQDAAVEAIKFLVKKNGPDWALKYVPLDDHIFELYDEARLILESDTW